MFLKAASEFPNEGSYRDILPLLEPEVLFSYYLEDFPQYGCSLLSRIPWGRTEGRTLIESLLARNERDIIEAIRLEKEVDKINWCLWSIVLTSPWGARAIVESDDFDKQDLVQKLNEEDDFWKIAGCVENIAGASEEVAREILKDLRPEVRDFMR